MSKRITHRYGDYSAAQSWDRCAKITDYHGTEPHVAIPSMLTEETQVAKLGDEVFYNCEFLESVKVPEGVISLGDDVFARCQNLREIILPDSITHIGSNAFQLCCALKYLRLPENLLEIEWEAFSYCFELLSLEIPETVRYIGNRAFERCESLTQIRIPRNVRHIGRRVFEGDYDLRQIVVDAENPRFVCVSGALIDREEHALLAYPADAGMDFCRVSEGVEIIAAAAFYVQSHLTHISFPWSLRVIEADAFFCCHELTEIDIPEGTERIEAHAFESCRNLQKACVPPSVVHIGEKAFRACDNLVMHVAKGSYAERFAQEQGISYEYIAYPEWICEARGDGAVEVYGCVGEAGTLLKIPPQLEGKPVKAIRSNAFAGQASLREVVLPEGLERIEAHAFSSCASLRLAHIPSSLRNVADDAFEGRAHLAWLVEEGSWGARYAEAHDIARIVYKVEFTGYVSISEVSHVTNSLIIPTAIYGQPVRSMDIRSIPAAECPSVVALPDTIDRIEDETFRFREGLQRIILPRKLSVLGEAALAGTGLKAVQIPETVVEIGAYAFHACQKLEEIRIPKSVQSIGEGAFAACAALRRAIVEDGVASISDRAFAGDRALQTVLLPASVHEFGEDAFADCPMLTLEVFPETAAEAYAVKHAIPYVVRQDSARETEERASEDE